MDSTGDLVAGRVQRTVGSKMHAILKFWFLSLTDGAQLVRRVTAGRFRSINGELSAVAWCNGLSQRDKGSSRKCTTPVTDITRRISQNSHTLHREHKHCAIDRIFAAGPRDAITCSLRTDQSHQAGNSSSNNSISQPLYYRSTALYQVASNPVAWPVFGASTD